MRSAWSSRCHNRGAVGPAAVPAGFLELRHVESLPHRVLVLLHVLVQRLPLVLFGAAAFNIDRAQVAAVEPRASPAAASSAVCGCGRVGVVVQGDGLAVRGRQQRGVGVPAGHLHGGIGMPVAVEVGRVIVQAAGLGAHGDQVLELVPAVDVDPPGHRAHGVGGVVVAVAVDRMLQPPGLPLRVELHQPQVVHVPPGGVHQFAEHALLGHVHHRHAVLAVAGLLQHDAMLARLLRRLHHLPALIQGDGRRVTSVVACLPPSMAATHTGAWYCQGVAFTTRSISSRSHSFR